MSDLLERVGELNPVPACAPPSIDDVWRKLERDPQPAERGGRRAGRRWGGSRGSHGSHGSRLSVVAAAAVPVLVVLVLVVTLGHHRGARQIGSAQRAASTRAVQRLANGTITCDFAATVPRQAHGAQPDAGPVAARGRSAIAYCRDRYRVSGHRGAASFIACQTSATNVAVYVADGRSDQCGRLGERAVPAGYAAAQRRLAARNGTTAASDDGASITV